MRRKNGSERSERSYEPHHTGHMQMSRYDGEPNKTTNSKKRILTQNKSLLPIKQNNFLKTMTMATYNIDDGWTHWVQQPENKNTTGSIPDERAMPEMIFWP